MARFIWNETKGGLDKVADAPKTLETPNKPADKPVNDKNERAEAKK